MSAIASNAETSKTPGRNNHGFDPDTSQGLGESEETCRVNGDEQNRFDHLNRQTENSLNSTDGGYVPVGKILSRLKQLEADYVSFLQFHHEKMQELESESRVRKERIQQSIEEIEKDIIDLMSINDVPK